MLVGTTRRDGAARISPVEPFLLDGEFIVRGTARAETGADMQRRYAWAVAASLGWDPVPGEFTCSPSTSAT